MTQSYRLQVHALILVAALTHCVEEDETGDDSPALEDLGDEEITPRAALYESEPNNTSGNSGVKTIELGENNYGSLSATDKVDYWRLQIKARTYVNLFLGDIPGGSDYDLELSKNGAVVWTGNKTGNQAEMKLWLDLGAGTYELKVSAWSNPQPGYQYRLRAAATAISRALEWVDVQMPYCQAINDAWDATCGYSCSRNTSQEKPEWDGYRSDCSGLVSWAWNLGAPGLTTKSLDTRFSTIGVTDLQPGDILLRTTDNVATGHTFLFERWIDKAARKASIIEEPTCYGHAQRTQVVFSTVTSDPGTNVWNVPYKARRFNMP